MTPAPSSMAGVRRRVLGVLFVTQVLGGVGLATGFALASLAAAELSGSDVAGGAALTSMVVGAATAAFGLSRLAVRYGRRRALLTGYLTAALGAGLAVLAVILGSGALLLGALLPFGAAMAAGLSARFAATDLAEPSRRARALAVVVWATTIGAVAGPNLADPAQRMAGTLGLVPATGPFLLCVVAFGLAAFGIGVGLRPDPLVLARQLAAGTGGGDPAAVAAPVAPGQVLRTSPAASLAVLAIALSHAVMVGLMSLTPVHMDHAGASLRLVGLVISLHVAGMYALSPVFGWLADRLGRTAVLTGGSGLLMLAGVLAATSAGSDTARLSAGLVALGLGWSAALVAGSALLTDAAAVADRAGVQGLSDVVMNVSGALGGILAGLTVGLSSYPVLGWAVTAIAVLLLLRVRTVSGRRSVGLG